MIISLPLIESIFPFHHDNFFPTLTLISAKTSIFDLPIIDGRPRYLVCREPLIGPRVLITSPFTSSGVLRLKNIDDLSVLILMV